MQTDFYYINNLQDFFFSKLVRAFESKIKVTEIHKLSQTKTFLEQLSLLAFILLYFIESLTQSVK